MQITIDLPDSLVRKIITGIMENFPEANQTLRCIGWQYAKLKFRFSDDEDGKCYNLTEQELTKAFALIFTDKWPKGCAKVPVSNDPEVWDDWLCQCDAVDFDAFVQLAIFSEVIYG